MIEILKELCRIPTAFGMENGILDHIEKNYAKDLGYSYDGMGNLTVLKKCGKDNAKKIMLAANTDACGFIVNYIEENGFIRVTKLGSTSAVSAAFTELVSDKGVHGFIVPEKGAEIKDGDASKLYTDIGVSSRKEAEKLVCLGDIFAVIPSLCELQNGRYGGNGTASRVPLTVLLKLLRDETFENADLYFSFNVQNTLRSRGAQTAAFDISPDLCICIDICESFDTAGANKRGEAVLGDGAVIIAKTSDFCAPPALLKNAEKLCGKNGIKYKTCVYGEKTGAAGNIAKCAKGTDCIEICVPARNPGSGAEIFDLTDMQNVYGIVRKIISQQ